MHSITQTVAAERLQAFLVQQLSDVDVTQCHYIAEFNSLICLRQLLGLNPHYYSAFLKTFQNKTDLPAADVHSDDEH